jgi:hypothetical protein
MTPLSQIRTKIFHDIALKMTRPSHCTALEALKPKSWPTVSFLCVIITANLFVFMMQQGDVMASLRAAAAGDEVDSNEEPRCLEAAGAYLFSFSQLHVS